MGVPTSRASAETRLKWLIDVTKTRIKNAAGDKAALESVRDLVAPRSMASIGEEAGIARPDLQVLLTVHRGRILHTKRRALESVLNLPPGGLGMVLAHVEDLERSG